MQARQENQRFLVFKHQAERDLAEAMQALNQAKRITKEQAVYRKAKMPLLILLSLIAIFLLSNYGNAFKLQANEDIHLIKL